MNTTTKDLWWYVMVMMVLSLMVIVTGCSDPIPKYHYADDVEVKSGFFKGCFGSVYGFKTFDHTVFHTTIYELNPVLCPRDGQKTTWKLDWINESDLMEGTKDQHDLVKFVYDETHKPVKP